jgi:hypothetical protein
MTVAVSMCMAVIVASTRIVHGVALVAVRVPVAPRVLPLSPIFRPGRRAMIVARQGARRDRDRAGVDDRLAPIHQQIEGR